VGQLIEPGKRGCGAAQLFGKKRDFLHNVGIPPFVGRPAPFEQNEIPLFLQVNSWACTRGKSLRWIDIAPNRA
jgi:hypothetical protein